MRTKEQKDELSNRIKIIVQDRYNEKRRADGEVGNIPLSRQIDSLIEIMVELIDGIDQLSGLK